MKHSVPLRAALAALALCNLTQAIAADKIGTVDTAFKWIGRDHDIIVEAYDDPGVQGVTCYVSRARTGGIKGTLGLAEDRAEASIACRQTGPIAFPQPLRKQEEVFSERMSIFVHGGRAAQHTGLPDLFGQTHRRIAAEQRHGGARGAGNAHSGEVLILLKR